MPDTKLPDSVKVKGTETNLTSKINHFTRNNKYARLLAKWFDWVRRRPMFSKIWSGRTAAVVSERPAHKVNILGSCYPEITSPSQTYRTNKQYKSKAVACGHVSLFCRLSGTVPRHNVKLGTQFINRYFPGVVPKCAVFIAELFWGGWTKASGNRPKLSTLEFCTLANLCQVNSTLFCAVAAWFIYV